MNQHGARCGLAVWNLEYRRLGNPQPAWPATLDDVAAAFMARRTTWCRSICRVTTPAQPPKRATSLTCVELPGAGHMDYFDPGSEAHAILLRWLAECLRQV